MNFGELVRLREVAALIDGSTAPGDGGDGQRQQRQADAAFAGGGAVLHRFG